MDLASPDAKVRLRAVQLLKGAAYPEAALPLARLLTDAQDDIQLEAIAAELNIFLAEPIVPRKRVALVVEVRNAVQAEPAFSAGPGAVGSRPVPVEVLTGLRTAARDENSRVAVEALYAFGTLAIQPGGDARRALLRAAGPDVAAFIGSSDPAMRYAAVRVLGRVFARRAQDEPIDSTIGDAVITALNDNDRAVKVAAMLALGAMRYERGVQALTDLFSYYGKGELAEASLYALAQIAHTTSAPLFIAQMSSKTTSLRGIAIEGLARVGDRANLAAIQAVIDKESEQSVVLAGAFALVLLGNGTDRPGGRLAGPAEIARAGEAISHRDRAGTHGCLRPPVARFGSADSHRHDRRARARRRSVRDRGARAVDEGCRSAGRPRRRARRGATGTAGAPAVTQVRLFRAHS